jgi:hypothetical protein
LLLLFDCSFFTAEDIGPQFLHLFFQTEEQILLRYITDTFLHSICSFVLMSEKKRAPLSLCSEP